MTMETDEGLNLLGALKARFAPGQRTEARRKAERRGAMTPAERGRKGAPKVQVNFRATAETKALIDALSERLGKSVTDVLARAVEELDRSTREHGDRT